jgi:beta-alanine degradation protein BauB
MSRRMLWSVAFVCLVVSAGLAQDPTKVAPNHYRLAFENQRVEVLYVHYGPHEKSAMHLHPAGVAVNITGGHLRFTDQHGTTQDVTAEAGEARWFPSHKHEVENLGDAPYNAVYIGIKGGADKAALPGEPPAMDMDEETKAIVNALLAAAKR